MTTIAIEPPEKTMTMKIELPVVNFSHIINLTDDTGMIQHAVFGIPNRKEGYCIDDNARAMLLVLWAGKNTENTAASRLLPVYLSFIHYMQTSDGYFRNFMTYTKETLEERGSEDSFGRTMMALGFLVNEGSSHMLSRMAMEIFSRAYQHVDKLTSLRSIASTVIGTCQYIKFNFPDDLKRDMVIKLSNKLVQGYRASSDGNWNWFEEILTYDNAMLPLSLLNAYEITQDDVYFEIAFEAMNFLESIVFQKNMVRPIGNNGWYKKGGTPATFDQQGIDVMAMVLFYQQAFRITREQKYLDSMYKSYQWFLGNNDLKLALYDPGTGGCADGLHDGGINLNQGAESTLAYWISHTVVAAALAE